MTEIDESVLLGDAGDGNDHDEPIDENVLLDEDPKDVKDEIDLYDDVIAPSNTTVEVFPPKSEVVTPTPTPKPQITTTFTFSAPKNDGKKYCVYVGNLLWYTTDADLLKALANTGIPFSQFADMKFFENRTNGQSKGYALVVFNSDTAVKMLMETLPRQQIHGQTPTVLSYNKANQAKLEEAQAKSQTRTEQKKKTDDSCVNMGTIRIGAGGSNMGSNQMSRPGGGPPPLMMQNTQMMRPQQPLMSNAGPPPVVQMRLQINGQPIQQQQHHQPQHHQQQPMMNRGPPQSLMGQGPIGQPMMQQPNIQPQQQPFGGGQMNPSMGLGMGMNAPPPGVMGYQGQRQMGAPMGGAPNVGIPGLHSMIQMNAGMRPPANGMAPVHVNPSMFPGMHGPPLSEAEFEDVMNRNRTVSTSAITRAVADAQVGDIKGASETILTAIDLIKHSRAGHDERCLQLVYTLQETLKGLESKGYSSRSKSHRDRSRSRERDRKRRRRSRSRSYSRSPSPRRSRRY